MKKLTALLALVLLFSVSLFILSSCGGDKTESKAESKTESKAESKTTSKAAESKAESQAESKAESQEESKPDIFTYDIDRTKTKTNVAAGKGYEVTAGAPSPSYPDEEDKTLTDGTKSLKSGGNFSEPEWVGIETPEAPIPAIVVNLGAPVEAVADFVAYLFNDDVSAIRTVKNVVVSVSEDGTNFVEAARVTPSKDDITFEGTDTTASYAVKIELEKGVKAQYVKFEFERDGWLFVSELEVNIYK